MRRIKAQLKKLKEDERGISTVWITMLIAFFGISIIYAITYDILCVEIFNIMIDTAPAEMPQVYFDNLNRFRILYKVLPFIAFFGVLLWSFIVSQKKRYEEM